MSQDRPDPMPPLDAAVPARADLAAIERSLREEAAAEQAERAHPEAGELPAITRDPAEPPALGGTSAPDLPADDEERAAEIAAEAGREAAADEQADEGRRKRFD